MGAITPISLPISSSLIPQFKAHLKNPFFNPIKPKSKCFRSTKVFSGSKLPNEQNESMFLDEDGVVKDMDGYLNYLSLEYDSVWDTKPSWCQPWTITLTGIFAIAGSWIVLQSVAVTAIVSFLICTWWYIFLYSYPKAYSDMIAERRKKVSNGVEDTFGVSKSQRSQV
ncbi:Protein of unknown function DUF6737 [Dillenia turbinata]|uniref:DUF6737 domain-containing protein n=1 Tax=Dillenia turbinata TaxID=194707 RepID=A0AAN8W0A2_9MAGN